MSTLIIYAGGTFGMTGPKPLRQAAADLSNLMQFIPKSITSNPDIKFIQHSRLVDSSSMSTTDWVDLCDVLMKNYDEFDAFIVIQGTDTLTYTASALSFMINGLTKTIIVTGSMSPIDRTDSDGIKNLSNSLRVIEHSKRHHLIPEVIVVFGEKILRGCRARKMSTAIYSAFDSPNYPLLGTIGEKVLLNEAAILDPETEENTTSNSIIRDGVSDLTLHPGISLEHVTGVLQLPTTRGLILRAYGMGTTPHIPELSESLQSISAENKKAIVCITQCPHGTIDMDTYEASSSLKESNVIAGRDMTPEAAMTKLMVGLSMADTLHDPWDFRSAIETYMSQNQRGEFS